LRAFVGAGLAAIARVQISDAVVPTSSAVEKKRLFINMFFLSSTEQQVKIAAKRRSIRSPESPAKKCPDHAYKAGFLPARLPRSEIGHLQTFGEPDRMSALAPKADIRVTHRRGTLELDQQVLLQVP
jgi:hypothetical protein